MVLTASLIQRKAQQNTTVQHNYRTRTARHYLEGGFGHVPGIAGLAHSQAPPRPQLGDTGNRGENTWTAVQFNAE
jgi:hypothetical protein